MPAKLPPFPDPLVTVDEVRTIGQMQVHGPVGRFQVPRVVVRIPSGGVSGADQVIADRESYIQGLSGIIKYNGRLDDVAIDRGLDLRAERVFGRRFRAAPPVTTKRQRRRLKPRKASARTK